MPAPEPPGNDASAAEGADAVSRAPTAAERVKSLVQQGWAALEKDDPQRAMYHFRQALRVRPDHLGARTGIVESLKARHPLYRWLLQRSFALGRMPPVMQVGVMLVAFVALRVISTLAAIMPQWGFILWPLLVAVFMLCILIGLASPIFTMLLSLDPEGKQALSDSEQRGANLLKFALLLPLPVLAWSILTNNGLGIVVWILLSMVALPASAIYRCAAGWPRWTMIGINVALVALILPLLASVLGELPGLGEGERSLLIAATVYSLLGAQIVATLLQAVRMRTR